MKKNAFTLIELLAVIVILAFIALIATPIILNIIDKVKGKARMESANGVLNAAKYFYTESLLEEDMVYPASGLEFVCNGSVCEATIGMTVEEEGISLLTEEPTVYTLKISGKAPSSGSITVTEEGVITPTNLAVDSYICSYNQEKGVFTSC